MWKLFRKLERGGWDQSAVSYTKIEQAKQAAENATTSGSVEWRIQGTDGLMSYESTVIHGRVPTWRPIVEGGEWPQVEPS